jgi:hypothetical protein
MRDFFARRADRRERAESEEGERAFEGMKVAFEDRDYATALLLADKTITICRKLYARSPSWTARKLGDRLRYRAEIRQEIGEYADALPDAEEAAELLGSDPHPRLPLEVPSTRLLVCELRAALGDHDGAMRYADAIHAFRESLSPDNQAAGLARYALAMFAVHEVELGTTAAWESIELYRPMLTGLARRDTLAQFAQMVYQLALHHEPPTAELAPRMLLALQDAAEQMVRTVPVYPTALASPLHRDHLLATLNILERQSMWLAPLAVSELAERYERLSYDLTHLPAAQWQDTVAQLRQPLEACLAHPRE